MKLEELEPKKVMEYFKQLCAIPHGSGNVQAVSDFLKKFAQDRNLEVIQDESLNIIIKKAASAGYEGKEPIILQGHMDMVAVAEDGSGIDMKTHPLDLRMDGDWLYADKTSLGGDDGIAVAMCMALLDDDSLAHPPLEVVLTTEEETNMGGASRIDLSSLEGKRLLNLDSEEEGILLCGCAGGGTYYAALPYQTGEVEGISYKLEICGLTGGHSGMEIGKGRASAALLLARVLTGLREDYAFRLVSLEGGAKYNAITREASAEVVLADSVSTSAFREAVKAEEAVLRREYAATDPSLSLTAAIADSEAAALTEESTKQVLGLMEALPYGVQRMSADIDGLVETSVNLGITKLEADKLTLSYSVRSSIATAFQAVIDKLELVSSCFGATALVHSTYPAWEYVRESAFRDEAAAIYRELFGKELSVQAIHAGLECGILSGKIKNLDAVSIGPDMKDIHSPKEMLNIPSVKRTWEYVCEALKSL